METTYKNRTYSITHYYDINLYDTIDNDNDDCFPVIEKTQDKWKQIIITFMIDKSKYWKQVNYKNMNIVDENAGKLLLQHINNECSETGIGIINKNKKIIYKNT